MIFKNASAVNTRERPSSCFKLKEIKGMWRFDAIDDLDSGRSFALKDTVDTFGKI